jgi:hypothetical protein
MKVIATALQADETDCKLPLSRQNEIAVHEQTVQTPSARLLYPFAAGSPFISYARLWDPDPVQC